MSSRRSAANVHPDRARPAAPRPRASDAQQADGDLSQAAVELAARVERELAAGRADALAPEALQALLAALCKAYSTQVESSGPLPPLPARTSVNATDVMVTTSALLKSVNLQLFELAMWQSWTGR